MYIRNLIYLDCNSIHFIAGKEKYVVKNREKTNRNLAVGSKPLCLVTTGFHSELLPESLNNFIATTSHASRTVHRL